MVWKDSVATIIRLTDPTERSMEIGHFAGRGLCFLNFMYAGQDEFRVGQKQAQELAAIFDHFAKHGELPKGPSELPTSTDFNSIKNDEHNEHTPD